MSPVLVAGDHNAGTRLYATGLSSPSVSAIIASIRSSTRSCCRRLGNDVGKGGGVRALWARFEVP